MYNSGFVPGFFLSALMINVVVTHIQPSVRLHKWSPLTATRPSASESISVFKEPSVPGAAAGKTVR